MITSNGTTKAIPAATMLGVIVFMAIWGFANSAMVTFTAPGHTLRGHLMEMGRPIQAIAVPPRLPPAPILSAQSHPRSVSVESILRPIATAVTLVTQPLPAVAPAPSDEVEPPSDQVEPKKQKGHSITDDDGTSSDDEDSKGSAKTKKDGSKKEKSHDTDPEHSKSPKSKGKERDSEEASEPDHD